MISGALNISSIRQNNLKTLYYAIYKYGPVSKRELQSITSLSWGSISTMVEELENQHYIIETGKIEGNMGRKTAKFKVNTFGHYILGIDLNVTGITAVATDFYGNIQKQLTAPIPLLRYDTVIETLFALTDNLIENECQNGTIHGIGIAVQGSVDTQHGISVYFPQIRDWNNVRLAELFERRYGIPTFLKHDPDCLMVAEKTIGSAREKLINRNAAFIRLDKGIGLSLSINNDISTNHYASEFGHICVDYNGPKCYCGANGCLEEYASADGIMRRYYDLSQSPYDPNINFKILAMKALEGDEVCIRVFRDLSHYLGTALSTLVNILPIDVIIIYGELTQVRDTFDLNMKKALHDHTYGNKPVEVIYSGLDLRAPATGAAIWISEIIIHEMKFNELQERKLP